MAAESYATFEEVKARLDEIVDAVSDDGLPLDDALALYEEAVGLGLRASDLLEENIEAHRAAEEAAGDGEGGQPAEADAPETQGAPEAPADASKGASGGEGARGNDPA